jgi:hypothetical protein
MVSFSLPGCTRTVVLPLPTHQKWEWLTDSSYSTIFASAQMIGMYCGHSVRTGCVPGAHPADGGPRSRLVMVDILLEGRRRRATVGGGALMGSISQTGPESVLEVQLFRGDALVDESRRNLVAELKGVGPGAVPGDKNA